MRRRRRGNSDSLGLLLDAICNTFGVVLLIAIVIAIMVQTSTSTVAKTDAPAQNAKRKLKKEINRLENDIKRKEAVKKNSEAMAKILEGPEDAGIVSTHQRLAGRLQETQERISELESQTESVNDEVSEILNTVNRDKQIITTLEEELDAIEQKIQLVSESATSTRSADLPQLRDNQGSLPLIFILRYGKLYRWHKVTASGKYSLNTDDFTIVGRGGYDTLKTEPKPWAGINLSDSGWETRLTTILNRYENTKFNLSFVVYKDSYPEFQQVKKLAVGKGYSYNLMPKGNVPILDRGGTNRIQ